MRINSFFSVLFGLSFFVVSAHAASLNRDSAQHYFRLGKVEQDARRYSNAWKHFEQSVKFDEANADVQLAIFDVCMKMNRMAAASKALEAAGKLRPEDSEIQWKLVKLNYDFGQFDKVIATLPALLPRVKDAKGADFMLGKSYYNTQNYGKAAEYLQRSLKNEPTAETAYLLGRMNVQMSNYTAAVPYYKQSLSLDSGQTLRYYEYAMVLATAGKFDEAVRVFQMTLDRGYKPRDDFYMNMAYAMADAKRSDEAVKILRELLSRRPQDVGLLSGLADVCYHSGRYKESIDYWDRILEMDDKNARVLYHIGMAYIKMGKDNDGKRLCDRAIQMEPALGVLRHEKQMAF